MAENPHPGALGSPSSDTPPPSTRLVHVFTAPTIPEGLLAKALLESDGLPVFVKGESEGPYRVGPVHLWVPEGLEVQARLLLEEARSGHLAEDPEET